MNNKQQISETDFTFLIIGFLIGTAIMLVPSGVIMEAKQDAWLSMFIATLPSIIMVRLLVSLQRMFPGQSIVQYSVKILGFPFGKIISGLLLWFALHLSILVLRNAEDFVLLLLLPQTPTFLIAIVIVIITAYTLKGGFEVLARVTIIILPALMIFFLVASFLSLIYADFSNILPFNENGYLSIIRGAIGVATFPFGEIIIFAFIIFHCHNTNKSQRFFFYIVFSIIVAFLVLDIGVLRAITVLGVGSSSRCIFPVFETTLMSPLGSILTPIVTLRYITAKMKAEVFSSSSKFLVDL